MGAAERRGPAPPPEPWRSGRQGWSSARRSVCATSAGPDDNLTSGGASEDISAIHVFHHDTRNGEPAGRYGADGVGIALCALAIDLDGRHIAIITGFLYAGDHRQERYYTDPEIGSIYASIEQSFPDKIVSLSEISQDSSTVLFFVSGPTDPGTYYMIKEGKASKVIGVNSEISSADLSPVQGIFATGRDGYKIPALVTVPRGEGPFPGIVMPHGGPWVRDYYGYDEWAQMLANRGYVVVQPNYRGSEGHGLEHWRAGDREWGQVMQNDIEDSLTHLVGEGLVDGDKLAIFGWSYGGYAAFVGATRENTPFNCSIAGAGISDIPPMRGRIGDSRFLRKYQEPTVAGFSPLDAAESVKMPMLIVHGEDDNTVPVEQSRMFVRELKRIDADYEYIEIKDMFHSPWRYEHNMAWFPEVFEFFETKCGF